MRLERVKEGGMKRWAAEKRGFSTKLHLRAEGQGKPMVLRLTAGHRHEQTMFEPLMEAGRVKRRGGGRPGPRPKRVVGDKGYSSGRIRRYLRRKGIGGVIPHKRNEHRHGRFDRAAYRERNRVERLINRLKQFRRVATRYEKRAVNSSFDGGHCCHFALVIITEQALARLAPMPRDLLGFALQGIALKHRGGHLFPSLRGLSCFPLSGLDKSYGFSSAILMTNNVHLLSMGML
jgi:transposase